MMTLDLSSVPKHAHNKERTLFERLREETEICNVDCIRIKAEKDLIDYAKSKLSDTFMGSEEIIESDRLFYRARIVHAQTTKFEPKDMGPPPYWLTTRGRVQPEGVSFLYTATEFETALAEVRPTVGDKVGIGEFQVKDKRRLKVLKIDQHLSYEELLDEKKESINFEALEKFIKASRFSLNHFSSPAGQDDLNRYKETIFIAQLIQEMGYDGLSYASACKPGSGVNYAFFSASHFVCKRVHHRLIDDIKITASIIDFATKAGI